jgi:hypothetical protein
MKMNPTRRSFLKRVAIATIAARFSSLVFAQQQLENRSVVADADSPSVFDGVSPQTFERWIGGNFRLSLRNRQLGSAVLVSVKNINAPAALDDSTASRMVGRVPRRSVGPAITSFSLRFRKVGVSLPQDTYTIDHDWLGTFPLLLVPAGTSGGQPTYMATFSVLDQPGSKK